MGRFLYKAMSDTQWGENEMDYAIVIPNFYDTTVKINKDEVEQIAFVHRDEFDAWMVSFFFVFLILLSGLLSIKLHCFE